MKENKLRRINNNIVKQIGEIKFKTNWEWGGS